MITIPLYDTKVHSFSISLSAILIGFDRWKYAQKIFHIYLPILLILLGYAAKNTFALTILSYHSAFFCKNEWIHQAIILTFNIILLIANEPNVHFLLNII